MLTENVVRPVERSPEKAGVYHLERADQTLCIAQGLNCRHIPHTHISEVLNSCSSQRWCTERVTGLSDHPVFCRAFSQLHRRCTAWMLFGRSSLLAPQIPLGSIWSEAISLQSVNRSWQIPHFLPRSGTFQLSSLHISACERSSR